MVSYEDGKFILRRPNDIHKTRIRRRFQLRRIIFIAASFAFSYVVQRGGRSSQQTSRADAALHGAVQDGANVEEALQSQSSNDEENEKQPPSISLNEQYLKHLQALDPIPKKVHIFFPQIDYWRNDNNIPFVEHSVVSLKRLNPNWNVTIYDDEMIDNVIRKAADIKLIPMEERDMLIGIHDTEGTAMIQEPAHIVERSDIARLMLMYTEGGFYIDADRLISKRIDDVLRPNVARLCLPTSHGDNFCQDLLCSSRSNLLFLSAIREATNRRLPLQRRGGWVKGGELFDLGPVLYNRQIFIHLFGGSKETFDEYWDNWGDDNMPMKLAGDTNGVIVTKDETACDDGFLVDDTLPECYDRDPLYELYGMKDWGPEVGSRWAGEEGAVE